MVLCVVAILFLYIDRVAPLLLAACHSARAQLPAAALDVGTAALHVGVSAC